MTIHLTSPTPEVRGAVRDVLTASADFHALPPDARREIAGGLVQVAHTARALADESGAPLATAQAGGAGSAFSGVATDKIASTTKAVLNAVSFPRFVTELITGVFKAMNDSSQQQMQAYVELIRNVAASTEGFADAQVGVAGARAWLAEKFPNFTVTGDDDDTSPEDRARMTPEERAEAAADRDRSTRLALAPGASMPSEAALRAALGLGAAESVPSGSPEGLVSFARAAMARSRQQMLASMVMMGLQRIVIESGRISAGMRFHIDTRSAADDDRGSSFDTRTEAAASGSFGYGPWGASASVKSTIGFVTTEQTRTTEEINTSVDLNSAVELVFRTDYVPLSRLAGGGDVDRIRVNTLNPAEEARLATAADTTRSTRGSDADDARRTSLSARLAAPAGSTLTAPPIPPPAVIPPASPPPPPAPPAAVPPAVVPPAAVPPPAVPPAAAPPAVVPPAAVPPARSPAASARPAPAPAPARRAPASRAETAH
ncbi:hypothetical protein VH567_00080 [Sphingomonas sp. 4RDLI-65]|uniref:hypothetical protein n=1 Tax=Sphingomonas sp. 4RDLI-65 TaxID=3111641 RepID=UPI003C2A9F2C